MPYLPLLMMLLALTACEASPPEGEAASRAEPAPLSPESLCAGREAAGRAECVSMMQAVRQVLSDERWPDFAGCVDAATSPEALRGCLDDEGWARVQEVASEQAATARVKAMAALEPMTEPADLCRALGSEDPACVEQLEVLRGVLSPENWDAYTRCARVADSPAAECVEDDTREAARIEILNRRTLERIRKDITIIEAEGSGEDDIGVACGGARVSADALIERGLGDHPIVRKVDTLCGPSPTTGPGP